MDLRPGMHCEVLWCGGLRSAEDQEADKAATTGVDKAAAASAWAVGGVQGRLLQVYAEFIVDLR